MLPLQPIQKHDLWFIVKKKNKTFELGKLQNKARAIEK
jgi:hypothetical protein